MKIDRIFKKKQLSQRLKDFSEFTGLNFSIKDFDEREIFQTDQYIDMDNNYRIPIRINGQELLGLVGFQDDMQIDNKRIALEFLHTQLEDIFDSEFSKQDLVKTTARFWKEMNFMYDFLSDINTLFDIDQIYKLITERIVKLLNVTRVSVVLSNNANLPEIVSSYGYDEADPLEFLNQIDFLVSHYVLKTGNDVLLNDLENLSPDLMELLESARDEMIITDTVFYPLLCIPLKTPNQKLIGALRIYSTRIEKIFSSDDRKLFNSIASQVSLVINNVNMINDIRETEKIKKEMELASIIQKNLLPKKIPQVDDLEIAGRCVSANAVGGDYYDVFQSDEIVNFVLADVSGHGISSALYMSNVRSTLRSLFLDNIPLSEVAYNVNNFICSDSGISGMFVTLFYARYYPNSKELSYINSGHNLPILYRTRDDSVFLLDTEGTPAGFIENVDYHVKSMKLEPGDILIMYTDGFIEAANKDGIMLGFDRFLEIIKRQSYLPSKLMLSQIYNEVYQYSDKDDQNDDMTLMIIKCIK